MCWNWSSKIQKFTTFRQPSQILIATSSFALNVKRSLTRLLLRKRHLLWQAVQFRTREMLRLQLKWSKSKSWVNRQPTKSESLEQVFNTLTCWIRTSKQPVSSKSARSRKVARWMSLLKYPLKRGINNNSSSFLPRSLEFQVGKWSWTLTLIVRFDFELNF